MTLERSVSHLDSLWIPGVSLEDEYPAATPEQLRDIFAQHLGTCALTLEGVLGVTRKPGNDEELRGVASIDLCEIVRSTAYSLATVHGKEYHGNSYPSALWEDERFNFSDGEENPFLANTIISIVQVMMNNGHVQPVEGIDEIADITARWRKNLGIYCVANTSTTHGCELATVSFINEHLPDSFDGIIFPRNPMGRRDQMTKSKALKHVIDELSGRGHDIQFAVHVDDSQGHHLSMIEDPPHPTTHVFLPEHPEFKPVNLGGAMNVTRSTSPVETFRAMDDYILQQT